MKIEKKIPFLDLKKQYLQIREEVLAKIDQVYSDTAFTGGKYVEEFENNFVEYCKTKFCVCVNSGTSALHLAMRILNIGINDEVVIPANTFIATAWAPSYVGAKPAFVDCDLNTWQIDPGKIEEKITSKTKAIIGVHLYGQPFDIYSVKKIADKYNLFLIEDAAQAHGAKYDKRTIGSFGDMACFSFYPGKNLGTYGEGGAITTNNKEYADRLRKLRNHASVDKYYHEEIGYNMRMGGTEGAVLNVKLKYIDLWNNRRKKIAEMYFNRIKNPKIKMQEQPAGSESVFHLFVVICEEREKLLKHLNDNGIFPGLHYPVPCHLQKAFHYLGHKKGDFPNSEYLSEHCLSLPMFAELSDEEIEHIIFVINSF